MLAHPLKRTTNSAVLAGRKIQDLAAEEDTRLTVSIWQYACREQQDAFSSFGVDPWLLAKPLDTLYGIK